MYFHASVRVAIYETNNGILKKCDTSCRHTELSVQTCLRHLLFLSSGHLLIFLFMAETVVTIIFCFQQESDTAVQNIHNKLQDLEAEHTNCSDMLRRQANELEFSAEREARLKKELDVSSISCLFPYNSSSRLSAGSLFWDWQFCPWPPGIRIGICNGIGGFQEKNFCVPTLCTSYIILYVSQCNPDPWLCWHKSHTGLEVMLKCHKSLLQLSRGSEAGAKTCAGIPMPSWGTGRWVTCTVLNWLGLCLNHVHLQAPFY